MGRLLFLLALGGCIGGRIGHQWRADGTSGVYGGPWMRAYSFDSIADVGTSHGILVGGEGDLLWAQGGHFDAGLGPVVFLAGDPDHNFGYGALAMFGFDFGDGGVNLHASLCATNFQILVAGVCGRWVPGSWAGIDAELGVSVLGLAVAAD